MDVAGVTFVTGDTDLDGDVDAADLNNLGVHWQMGGATRLASWRLRRQWYGGRGGSERPERALATRLGCDSGRS